MNKQNSLNLKEKNALKNTNKPKNLRKDKTMKNFNNKKIVKLNLDLFSYNRLTNKNNRIKNSFSTMEKNNKNNSLTEKIKKKKDSILYKKFLEFKKNNKQNKQNFQKDNTSVFFSLKSSSSLNTSYLSSSKRKKKKNIKVQKEKPNLTITNLNIIKKFKKKNSAKIINKTELFNHIINNNEQNEENKENYFKRNNSCIIFNNKKLQKDFGLNNFKNKKINEKNKKNNTLKLVSQNYFEKIKFKKYKYYNEKNNDYAKGRRKRVEDKLNEIIYEKYKISRPLRMTQRVFCIDEESKIDKNINKKNYDNNIFKISNNNNFINNLNFHFYLNDIDIPNVQNNDKNNQIIYYNNKINNIIKMRRDLSIEDFFGGFRRDYNLLDFNFTFLFQNKNNNKRIYE